MSLLDENDPDNPDETDVCPHGKGFSDYCGICDEEDDWDDEPENIPVCPECGSDDLTNMGEEYVCEDCGEVFGEDDLEEGE